MIICPNLWVGERSPRSTAVERIEERRGIGVGEFTLVGRLCLEEGCWFGEG